MRGFRWPVRVEHAVVDVEVDLRAEDVADEEGQAERGCKQPHVRRRTVPGQAKRKAHFSLSITGGVGGAGASACRHTNEALAGQRACPTYERYCCLLYTSP